MPFNRPTLDEIKTKIDADIKSRLPATSSKARNTLLEVLGQNSAGTAHSLYGAIEFYARQIFPDSATDEFLDRQLAWRGVYRIPANAATGTVLLTGNELASIPMGAELKTTSGTRFKITASGSIHNGKAMLSIESLDLGTQGNLSQDTPLQFIIPIAGVEANALIGMGGTTGGADIESDEAYRVRGLKVVQGEQSRYGKPGDWVSWAMSSSTEITKAFETKNVGNMGKLLIQVINVNEAPSVGAISACIAYIKERAPLGIIFEVKAPRIQEIPLALSINPDTTALRMSIKQAILSWFDRQAKPGFNFVPNELEAVMANVIGITSASVVVPSSHVLLNFDTYPKAGSITWR